ncbi:MAG: hypothetical protein RJA70_682 [Pseudomonadota bacterium]|jgi:hypothetical protein
MLVHSVYFWFKKDADPGVVTDFENGLKRLSAVPQIRQVYYGRPEETPPRPVLDSSYDWALYVMFDDLAAHDAYQAHELHDEFLAKYKASWARVQVYDART